MAPYPDRTGIARLKAAFVRLRDSARSVIAAAQFCNLTAALGLAVEPVALGTDPERVFSLHVLDGLHGDGLTLCSPAPVLATRESLRDVSLGVSYGPDITPLLPSHCDFRRWENVPAVVDSYRAASVDIHRRVALLVDELLRGGGSPMK
jgi:hypothetical protein